MGALTPTVYLQRTTVDLGIDQESCAALEAVNYQPFFGLGRVTFRVSQRQTGAKDSSQ